MGLESDEESQVSRGWERGRFSGKRRPFGATCTQAAEGLFTELFVC